MRPVFFDISALTEPQWSGIARLTAKLAHALLERDTVTFFYRDFAIGKDIVRRVLAGGSAAGLLILMKNNPNGFDRIPEDLAKDGGIGIYSNLKFDRKRFDRYVFIAYDISFLLTPELHDHARTVSYRRLFYSNVRDAGKILAISEATKRDLVVYFRRPPEQIFVAHPGCDPLASFPPPAARRARRPFFLVLGTIEPRKNIGLLLEFLRQNRRVMLTYDFVFVGKVGWGATWQQLIEAFDLTESSVLHRGFVSDEERDGLLADCEALIFPSLFEGYGLPVLEALAHGKIVLGSRSSGIVEAGGGHMIDFDPTNLASFKAAFERFTSLSDTDRLRIAEAGYRFASERSWARFVEAAIEGFGLDAALEQSGTSDVPV